MRTALLFPPPAPPSIPVPTSNRTAGLKKQFPSCCLACFLMASILLPNPCLAETQSLVDLIAPNVSDQVQTDGKEVSYQSTSQGIEVRVAKGEKKYPGIVFIPEQKVWDLSKYGHVEARLKNTSNQKLIVSMRVDDSGGSEASAWNQNHVVIEPGESRVLSVIFGYDYNRKLGYALDASKIIRVLLYTQRTAVPKTFMIEQLIAAGTTGEKPPPNPDDIRIKPIDGLVVGASIPFELPKQFRSTQGCLAKLTSHRNDKALRVDIPANREQSEFAILPPAGRWDFRQATEVKVLLKNVGEVPLTPAVQISSGGSRTTDLVEADRPVDPGQTCEIVIPFLASMPWEGPDEEVHGANVVGKPHTKGKPGTGTEFTSDQIDRIRFVVHHSGAASLLVESISAVVTPARTPEWLGKRPPVDGQWEMTFQDEFDDNRIDPKKWTLEGPNYWGLKHLTHWSKRNVTVENGMATMRMEKKRGFHNDDPESGHESDYVGGHLSTLDHWTQLYGYFESRMKLPTAPGLWPAFWTMPDRGRSEPKQWRRSRTTDGGMEFDIMEHLTRWGPYRYNIAMHWNGYHSDHKSIGSQTVYVRPDKEGFLTTGLLWTPGSAVFYCNGQEVGRWKSPEICSIPSYMMFTVPIGGWDNDRIDDGQLPADLVIDYVRVWQRKDLASKADGFMPALSRKQ